VSSPTTPTPHAGATPRRAADLLLSLPVVVASAWPTWWLLDGPASFVAVTGALFVGLGAVILVRLPAEHPGPGIGAANRITLLRAALALPVLALGILAPGPAEAGVMPDAVVWWVIVTSTVAMVLDGLDGRVARRTETETDFGARFDMEFDAALIMALSVLVWSSGKVGAWVLLVGLMRYLFVAAAFFAPALNGPLPESFRRKVVCVVQGVVLLVALGPIIPALVAIVVAAGGLLALTWSFAVDIAWLLRASEKPAPVPQ
jgi:phosphatidylglycerophosphate synthase